LLPEVGTTITGTTITIVVTSEDGETSQPYTVFVTRDDISTDTTLSTLELENVTLDPTFETTTTSYQGTAKSGTSQTRVIPTANHAGATITVNGAGVPSGSASEAITLKVGLNPVAIKVTAEDGLAEQTYTVLVTRLSDDATLSNLELSGVKLTPDFATTRTDYMGSAIFSTTQTRVMATATHSAATITVNDAELEDAGNEIELKVGLNTIEIKVTAESGGRAQTYKVLVIRDPISADATLSDLALENVDLSSDFSRATLSYMSEVAHRIDETRVIPTANHAGAKITVNGTDVLSGSASDAIVLGVGLNTIEIKVTAEDGLAERTYTVFVTRDPISDILTLSDLKLENVTLDPSFATTITQYNIVSTT